MNRELIKSLSNIISTFYTSSLKIKKYKLLIHTPSIRFNPSFIIYFAINPESALFITSSQLYNNFIDEFYKFKKWVLEEYINKIPEELKKYYKNFGKNVEIINSKNYFNQPDEFFNFSYAIIKAKIDKFKNANIINKINEEVIIDITGAKKIHSILLHEISQKLNTSYSYLSVNEKAKKSDNKLDIISAESGTEVLIINNKKSGSFDYHNFEDTLDISITSNQIRFFYNEYIFRHSININNKTFKILKEKINILNQVLPFHIRKNLENMVIPLYNEIVKLLKRFLTDKLYNFIKNYDGKIIKLIFDDTTYNIPLEFLIDSKKYLIVKKIVIPAERTNNKFYKNDELTGKINMLIIKNGTDDIFFEKSLAIFKNLEKHYNNIVNFEYINIDKMNGTNKTILQKKFDIIHYIGHTSYDNKGMFIPVYENLNKNIKKIYFNNKIFKLNSKMVFFNSCFSSSIDLPFNKSFISTFLNNFTNIFIGNKWNIRTDDVYNFNKIFYENLFTGKTAGESFYIAINSFNTIFIKNNYSFFGNPYFKFNL